MERASSSGARWAGLAARVALRSVAAAEDVLWPYAETECRPVQAGCLANPGDGGRPRPVPVPRLNMRVMYIMLNAIDSTGSVVKRVSAQRNSGNP